MSDRDSTGLLFRSFADADLSIRSDGRTIYGLAVPFGTSTPIRDAEGTYSESFQRGAFAQTINRGALHRVKLFVKHDRKSDPLGRAIELREDDAGLVAALRVSKTQRGDEIIELVRDGALDQLSIGFRPHKTIWDDLGHVDGRRSRPASGASAIRTEVALDEISVVDFAAYDLAVIGGVRDTSNVASLSEPVVEPVTRTDEPAIGASWDHLIRSRDVQRRLARFLEEHRNV